MKNFPFLKTTDQHESGALLHDRRRFFLGVTAFWLAGHTALRAEQEPTPKINVTTRLVNVYATVRDRNNLLVQNLKKEDFTVKEDGRPQTIDFFSHESDLPLTLGILIDTSPSEAKMIDQEREASRTFLRTVLDSKKDAAFLLHFDHKIELLQELTQSLQDLDRALDRLDDVAEEPHLEGNHAKGYRDGQESSENGDGSTHLYDAVYLAAKQILKPRSGRKALIIVGDGDDMGSTVTQGRAIRAAQQADAMIYCIRIVDKDFGKDKKGKRRFNMPLAVQLPGIPGLGGPGGGRGEGGPMGGPGGGQQGGGPGGGAGGGQENPGGSGGGRDEKESKQHMLALAEATGGSVFEVSKKVDLGDIFAQIAKDLRSQYSLAYKPQANALGGYRIIQVGVRRKNLFVQAREGYYADSDE